MNTPWQPGLYTIMYSALEEYMQLPPHLRIQYTHEDQQRNQNRQFVIMVTYKE